jgi:hypothetical protein
MSAWDQEQLDKQLTKSGNVTIHFWDWCHARDWRAMLALQCEVSAN